MSGAIQAIRGMNDILPQEIYLWQFVENTLREILQSFAYHEIRVPLLEKTELFKRSIGEATDIVEKEMYTFLDRNEESLTLRPEGTASCVRAGIEHGLLYNQIQRLWYTGPYFRYERPQKGRYRQFYQCGAEVFGIPTPDIDAELILLSATLFEKLGLSPYVTLQINSLGSVQSRANYRQELVAYFTQHINQLDEDSKRRLTSNPLRILDSKNPALQELLANAPKLIDFLDEESSTHFKQLQKYLTTLGISFVINPCLVRGLDYYTKTVFEWVTHELGAQGTVCAGGRYDGLVEQLGGKTTPALGFALGLERTVLLLQTTQPQILPKPLDVYFITDSEASFERALQLTRSIRKNLPHLSIVLHCGGGNFKNQMKKADKSGARLALIIGEEERLEKKIKIKFLREEKNQITTNEKELEKSLQSYLNPNTRLTFQEQPSGEN